MAKQENPSTHDETDSVQSGKTACQPSPSVAKESLELNLSEGQRHTILKYALLDHVAESAYRAKGNEKQKVLRIVEKVSKLLGSTIDPDEMPKNRLPKKTDTVFQIKMTLKGIDHPFGGAFTRRTARWRNSTRSSR